MVNILHSKDHGNSEHDEITKKDFAITFENWTPFCDLSKISFFLNGKLLGKGSKGRERLMFEIAKVPSGSKIFSYPVSPHDYPEAEEWKGKVKDVFRHPTDFLILRHGDLLESMKISIILVDIPSEVLQTKKKPSK